MRIKEFLQDCPKKAAFYHKGLAKNRRGFTIESRIIPGLCRLFKQKAGLDELEKFIKDEVSAYSAAWFDMEAQLTAMQELDRFVFGRLAGWYAQDVAPSVRDGRCWVPVKYEKRDLETKIPLLVQYENGRVEAFLIRKKNYGDFSAYSRKSPMDQDIEALLVLYYLATSGLATADLSTIYLYTKKDLSGELGGFVAEVGKPSAKANLQRYRYSELRDKDGNLLPEKIEEQIELAIDVREKTPKKPYCPECQFATLCHVTQFSPVYVESTKQSEKAVSGKLPQFTGAQKEAINYAKGQLVLLSCPGSGKTATIVGRAVHMIKDLGISAHQILIVAYTNETANELKARFKKLIPDASMQPEISTVNALGYDILLAKAQYLEYEPQVANDQKMMHVAYDVLSKRKPIGGLSYATVFGQNGVVSKFLSMYSTVRVKGFEAIEEDTQHYENLDKEAFRAACEAYEEAMRGLITFDEQVSLCTKLLKDNPGVLKGYRLRYKYIMVDEYQDMTPEMDEFIKTLAGEGDQANLCVAGDEDQSIYGFTGADNEYILNFQEAYPNAKVIVLKDNFRSSQEICDSASRIINESGEERVKKDIVAHMRGEPPFIYPRAATVDVESIIQREHEVNGVPYSQIAVIARRNDSLEDLDKELKCPTQIVKAYACTDPVAQILRDVYCMYYKGITNEEMYHLLAVFNRDAAENLDTDGGSVVEAVCRIVGTTDFKDAAYFERLPETDDPVITVASFLSVCFQVLDAGMSSMATVRQILEGLGIADHVILEELSDAVKKDETLKDNREMATYLDDMVLFSQGGRLNTATADAVQLVTAHDSKGSEWDVVILWRAENFSVNIRGKRSPTEKELGEYEEMRRLLYVAMTRPRLRLYILQDKPASGLSFIEDILALDEKKEA